MDTIDSLAQKVGGSDNTTFNSEVHATTDSGQPKYTRSGKFRRKPSSSAEPVSEVNVDDVGGGSGAADYTGMGEAMAVTITASCTMMMGEDWKPEQQEVSAIAQAWAKYFEAKGIQDFPPSLMLGVVHFGYITKRLTMPQTKSKIGNLVIKWKARRAAKKYARSNRRNDQFRQDDSSQEPSSEIQS